MAVNEERLPPEKPKSANQSADNHGLLDDLWQSFGSAAIQQPKDAINQLIGELPGGGFVKDLPLVGTVLDKQLFTEPTQAKFGSTDWVADTIGGALGMIVPFAGTSIGLRRVGLLSDIPEGATASSMLGMSVKDSAITGFAYQSILTPSSTNGKNFLVNRLESGVGGAVTFGALTASSIGLSNLGGTKAIENAGLSAVLKNRVANGVLAGIPGGVINSEFDSYNTSNSHASWSQLGQAVASMSLIGGVFGAHRAPLRESFPADMALSIRVRILTDRLRRK